MTKKEFKKLEMGDKVKHKEHGMIFVVLENYDKHIVAVSSTTMTIPEQWEKIK
jgi:hypothetical protein